jgi:hypothetical protein
MKFYLTLLSVIFVNYLMSQNSAVSQLKDELIIKKIESFQPLKGAKIPLDIRNRLGATHSSYWSTGLGTYTDEVPEALGFDPLDYRFVGFLAIGTPMSPAAPAQRPLPETLTTTWRPD